MDESPFCIMLKTMGLVSLDVSGKCHSEVKVVRECRLRVAVCDGADNKLTLQVNVN